MAYVLPAFESQMGNVKYYESTMLARDLVSGVRTASQLDDWATWGIEERMQREVDMKRIKEEIVPYLAKSPDRFFGSVIILVYKPKVFTFEPVKTLSKVPAAYKTVVEHMGFLTVDGGELIVLDGQHRIFALREIIDGKIKPLGDFVPEIPHDRLCVLFLLHEDHEKTRRIFNKVNRYAKPTSRADNIITSEDDGYAIVARRLMRKEAPLGHEYIQDNGGRELLVDWRNNTITGRSQKFSTISVLYETSKDILAHEGIRGFDEKIRVRRPSDEELDRAYEIVSEWWETLLKKVKPYNQVIEEVRQGKTPSCSKYRNDDEQYSLLFKPAGQIALVKGLIKAIERRLDRQIALERINKIDWRTSSGIWKGSIVTPSGRMSTSKSSYDLASELIAYLIGADRMTQKQIEALTKQYNEARGFNYKNPKEGTEEEKLPTPVV